MLAGGGGIPRERSACQAAWEASAALAAQGSDRYDEPQVFTDAGRVGEAESWAPAGGGGGAGIGSGARLRSVASVAGRRAVVAPGEGGFGKVSRGGVG